MENENIGNHPDGFESDSSSSDFSPPNDTFCNGDCFPSKDSDDTSTEDSMSEESESADSSTDSASSEYSSSDEGNVEGSFTSGVKFDNSAESGPPCYTSDSDYTSGEMLTSDSSCECGECKFISPSEDSSSTSLSSHFLYYDRTADSDSEEEPNDEDEEYNETSGAAAGGELSMVYGQEPNYEELSTEDIAASELDDSIGFANFLLEFTERYGDQMRRSSLEIIAKNSWELLHFSERLQYQIARGGLQRSEFEQGISEDEDNAEPKAKMARFEELP